MRHKKASGLPAIDRLSDWALVAVFSCLPDLCSVVQCSRVCRRWRSLVLAHPNLWAGHTLEPASPRLSSVPQCVPRINLERMESTCVPRAVASLFEAAQGGQDRPQLVSLALGTVEPRALSVLEVLAIGNNVLDVPALRSLRSFQLTDSYNSDTYELRDVESLVRACPLLEDAWLRLDDAGLLALARLEHLASVREARVAHAATLDALARAPCAASLRDLTVRLCAQWLDSALPRMRLPGLRRLSISGDNKEPTAENSADPTLADLHLPVLRSLLFTSISISGTELQMIGSLPVLETLRMTSVGLAVSVLPPLLNRPCSASLRELRLISCSALDVDLEDEQCDPEGRFKSLRSLELSYCNDISKELVCSFAERSPMLVNLTVFGCCVRFPESMRQRLKSLAPALEHLEIPTPSSDQCFCC
eukprot:m51a1_g14779 hypothetical protein (420) ;mRNA; f:444610-446092